MTKQLIQRWDLFLCLLMLFAFLAWPGIDLEVAQWFYQDGNGFFLSDNGLVQLSYHLFADLHFYVLGLLIALLLWAIFSSGKSRPIVFLLVTLVLGPGLLVNEVVKAESGRARPLHIEVFGGDKRFTPALIPSDQCDENCSFVSGHAAMGFFFLSLAWVTGYRRWLVVGIVLGSLVGLGRMMQGAHFLSDVIFAFWIVYLTALLMAKLFFGSTRIRSS